MQPKSDQPFHLFWFDWAERAACGILVRFFIFGILASSATGCGGSGTTTPAAVVQAQVLRVAVPDKLGSAIVSRYSHGWSASMRTRVEIVQYDPAIGPESGGSADVWIVPPARMPGWAAKGELLPVPDSLKRDSTFGWDDVVPLYRQKLLVWDESVYALPVLGDARICFYRFDLIGNPVYAEKFKSKFGHELATPSTWDAFVEIAEFFNNQPRPGLDRPSASLPSLPLNDDELDREYYEVAASLARQAVAGDDPRKHSDVEVFSFHYDLDSGQPRLSTPGFVRALEILQRLQSCRAAQASEEPPASFQRGEAVLCIASPAWITRFQSDEHVRGKFSFCAIPGSMVVYEYASGQPKPVPSVNRVPYLGAGGLVAVVPRNCAQPDKAFALLAELGNPRTSRDIVIEPEWGGGVYRREQLDTRVGWQSFALGEKETADLVDLLRDSVLHARVRNPVLRLRIPDQAAHQRVLDAALRSALSGKERASQALDEVVRRWQALDAGKDPRARRNEYRLSLSLSRGS